MPGVFPKTGESMWLAEYDIDVYNAPEVFSVPPLTRLILPVMSGRTCPDISGSFGITGNDADRGFSTSHTDGCFTTKTTTLGGLDSGASSYRTGIPYFVASRVSSIFGGSSGVDVSAVYALIIIKV